MNNLNDPFYTNKQSETPEGNELYQHLIEEKRSWFYEFFSNKLSLVLVIIFGLALIVSLYNYTDTLLIELRDPTSSNAFAVINFLINVVISVILPYGIYLIYMASRRQSQIQFSKGLNVLMLDLKIKRIILFFASVALLVLSLMLMRFGFGGILLLLFGGLLFWLLFVIIKIFTDFVSGLKQSFYDVRTLAPSSTAIKTYITIILVLNVIFILAVFLLLEFLVNSLELDELLTGVSMAVIRLQLAISFFILLAQVGYFLFYTIKYESYFSDINDVLRRKIDNELDREIE